MTDMPFSGSAQHPKRLSVHAVSRRVGSLALLAPVSLRLGDGERHAIVGTNGSGKSTLFDIICGRIVPSAGHVEWDGGRITGWSAHRIARLGLARTMQGGSGIGPLPARDALTAAWLAGRHRRQPSGWRMVPSCSDPVACPDPVALWLDRTGLTARADEPAGSLDPRSRRLLEIAMALIGEPRIVLLDEPTAGLTRTDARRTVEWIDRWTQGIGLLIAEHDAEVIGSLTSTVTVLKRAGEEWFGPDPVAVSHAPSTPSARAGVACTLVLCDVHRAPTRTLSIDLGATPVVAIAGRDTARGTRLCRQIAGLDRTAPIGPDITPAIAPTSAPAIMSTSAPGVTPACAAPSSAWHVGSVRLDGVELLGRAADDRARRGVGHVAAVNDVFGDLTVEQNLIVGLGPGRLRDVAARIDEALSWFEPLRARRHVAAAALSGGERRMLCLARAAMRRPRVLLLDSPTEGLAVKMLVGLADWIRALRAAGTAVMVFDARPDRLEDLFDAVVDLDGDIDPDAASASATPNIHAHPKVPT